MALPIMRTALEQLHKLGLRSHGAAGPQVDEGVVAEHEADVLTTASELIEKETGRCMITELPGELRNLIYECPISNWNNREIDMHPQETMAQKDGDFLHHHALSQTCHLFREEYAPLLKSRFVFSIELAFLRRYLDGFHPAMDPSNPFRRQGGSITLRWMDYVYAGCEDTRLDLLSLTRIIHESPDSHISFEQQWKYPWFNDVSGCFLVEALVHSFVNWRHLAEQLTAIGLTGIYLRMEDCRKLKFRSGQEIHKGWYTVMLEFNDSSDDSELWGRSRQVFYAASEAAQSYSRQLRRKIGEESRTEFCTMPSHFA